MIGRARDVCLKLTEVESEQGEERRGWASMPYINKARKKARRHIDLAASFHKGYENLARNGLQEGSNCG